MARILTDKKTQRMANRLINPFWNMSNYLKQQAEAVTQERFDRLPALLTAYQVKLVTGLSDHDLKAFVGDGVIEARRRPVRSGCQRAYAKYTKASVGRLAGYKT